MLLREGAAIHLKFGQKLSDKTAAFDNLVNFVLAEDLLVAAQRLRAQ